MWESTVRSDVDISNFTAVRFVGLDVNSTVRIPEADGAISPAAQAILAVAIEPRSQNRSLVSSQDARLPLRQLRRAHPLFHGELLLPEIR